MFSQLFFLMLVSLITAFAIDTPTTVHPITPETIQQLLTGLFVYAAIVIALCSINRYLMRGFSTSINTLLFFDNVVIIATLGFVLLPLGALDMLASAPFPLAKTVTAFVALALYFFALYACTYFCHMAYNTHKRASQVVRFLLPFVVPFFLATFALDVLDGSNAMTESSSFASMAVFVAVVLATMIFFPPLIVWLWRCPPLHDDALTTRLDAICARTNFTHGGYRLWTVVEDAVTAAIVGLVGRLRYILFTKKLLEKLPPESIEAILAHEIGHNKKKHLWIYPWILFGMLVTASAAADLSFYFARDVLEMPEPFWIYLQIGVFVTTMALYFRYVFGYFSRLFERQADLYVYEAGVDPNALITSFQQLAQAIGANEKDPSWHHYSIRERIEFLESTQKDPSLIHKHDRKVYLSLVLFTFILIILIIQTHIF